MIPIVNDKYKYIIYYCPKSACSFIRKLFYELHKDEAVNKEIKLEHHMLNMYFPYYKQKERMYRRYTKIILVRDPYSRVLSMYYNKIVLLPHGDKLKEFIPGCETFTKFLQKLNNNNNNKDCDVDIHLRNQCYNPHNYLEPDHVINIDQFDKLLALFKIIFKQDKLKYDKVVQYFKDNTKLNMTNYLDYKSDTTNVDIFKMSTLPLPVLSNMMTPITEQLIYDRYRQDFQKYKFKRYYGK